jgi:hypothetical protein
VYVAHCGYECPNTDSNDLPCPYVHGLQVSCSSINHQLKIHLEKKALEESLGSSSKSTTAELEREESNKKKVKAEKEHFTCTMKIAGNDCPRGHDHQAARLASYALLQKHQHTRRIVCRTETETFDKKITHEALQEDTQPKSMIPLEATPLSVDATLTLVVQSMSYDTTEEGLQATFEKYGNIKRVNILQKDGMSKGTGFVDFIRLEDAAKALNAMQGAKLDGRSLRVKFKEDRSSGAGGSSRACFSCGQEGHMSRECPSKEPNQGGGGGGYHAIQDQSAGQGWAATEGQTVGGNNWEGAGETNTQDTTGDWDIAGTDATQSLTVGNEQWE